MNYLPKCTLESSIINQYCSDYIQNKKYFEFNYNCSIKFPYELIEENKCVEYCDDVSLLNGTCKLDYFNFTTDTKITTIPIISSLVENSEIESDNTNFISDTHITTFPIFSSLNEDSVYTQITTIPIISSFVEDSDFRSDNTNVISNILITTIPIFSPLVEDSKISSDKSNLSEIENISSYLSETISETIIHSHYNRNENIKEEKELIIKSIYEKIENILNGNNDDEKDNNNIIEDIKDLFSSGQINDQLDNIINGENEIVVNNKDSIIQITSSDKQKNNENYNISSINLGECETILKNEYSINQNASLLILKIDSFIEGSKIPDIQYEVYHPINKSKLDLSFCDNAKIEINIPVSIDEDKLYKYEPESNYYNDRCFT